MIYNISSISNYLSNLHRSRTEDNRPYICRNYRIQPYSKGVRKESQFRHRLLIEENLRVERELKEFQIRWLDDVKRINEIFEAGEDDLLFPTERYCESVEERGIFEAGEDDSLSTTNHESGNSRTIDTSQPLWGIDWLLRNEGKGTANDK